MSRTLSRRTLAAGLGAGLIAGACGGDDVVGPVVDEILPLATPLAAVPGFDEPRRWASRTVRIGLWGGEIQQAIASAVLDPFSALTGAVVLTFQADYDRFATSVAAGEPYLDLMVADLTRVDALEAAGTTLTLPEELVEPTRLAPFERMTAAMPLYAYAMVNAVRRDLAAPEELPGDWLAWADLDRYPSPRSLPGSPLGTLEIALLMDGVDRDELYPLDVERALAKLDALVATVGEHWWRSGDEAVIWLIQQEVALVATWHHRVVAAQLDGRPIDIAWRDAPSVADYLVVPAGSPIQETAFDLIRFALTDEVQSVLAYASQLGPVVPGAFRHLSPAQARRLPTQPERTDDLVLVDRDWWGDNRAAVTLRFDQWLVGKVRVPV